MAPIVLTLVQGLLLLLLYLFVWRVARAILRDLRATPAVQAPEVRERRRRPAAQPSREPRPESRGRPRELVVHRAGGRPTVLPLDGRDISFGRSTSATVVLDDPYVSDRHARVSLEGSDWVLTDLDSTNGTYVNQVKVTTPTRLAAGDQLGIGKTMVEVRR
jgi:pSer/pThr/pTyr-binding forkhead associated (FHA) protein